MTVTIDIKRAFLPNEVLLVGVGYEAAASFGGYSAAVRLGNGQVEVARRSKDTPAHSADLLHQPASYTVVFSCGVTSVDTCDISFLPPSSGKAKEVISLGLEARVGAGRRSTDEAQIPMLKARPSEKAELNFVGVAQRGGDQSPGLAEVAG